MGASGSGRCRPHGPGTDRRNPAELKRRDGTSAKGERDLKGRVGFLRSRARPASTLSTVHRDHQNTQGGLMVLRWVSIDLHS